MVSKNLKEGLKYSLLLVGTIGTLEIGYQLGKEHIENRNISNNYVKPKQIEVSTVDRDYDGAKETVLIYNSPNGKKIIELTPSNLEKIANK